MQRLHAVRVSHLLLVSGVLSELRHKDADVVLHRAALFSHDVDVGLDDRREVELVQGRRYAITHLCITERAEEERQVPSEPRRGSTGLVGIDVARRSRGAGNVQEPLREVSEAHRRHGGRRRCAEGCLVRHLLDPGSALGEPVQSSGCLRHQDCDDADAQLQSFDCLLVRGAGVASHGHGTHWLAATLQRRVQEPDELCLPRQRQRARRAGQQPGH
mmetsp:Transcript_52328/g.135483  ORF Transcript_52328/g.135483 Transcript_52328/m.135483 type:complete len:216 (-) Transcript_52328:13-660(-)